MVPQGQVAYYTPTPAPAPPPCETPPLQFSQHPHVPYMQSGPPVTSLESSHYAHPTHQVAYVDASASSRGQPFSAHHGNYVRIVGSEHAPSASLPSEGTTPCAWHGQFLPRCSSPPPPAYPPGFEPKHDTTSYATMNATTGFCTVSNSHSHPQPYSQPQPHSYDPYSQLQSQSQSQPQFYAHSHAQHPCPYPYPYPEAYTQVDSCLHQHQHQQQEQQQQHLLQMEPPHLHPHPQPHPQPQPQPHPHPHPHPHQHQSSQMAYPALQMACQTPMSLPAAQVANSSMFQNFDGSGTVIGVPVIGTPVYLDATNSAPPSEILQYQQPMQSLQPESAYSRQQSCKSTYHLTKYYRRSVSGYENLPEEVRLPESGWQPPPRENNRLVYNRKYSRAIMDRTFVPKANKPSIEKPDQQQLALAGSNGCENHYLQQRVLSHDLSACVDGEPNHFQSNQIPNFKETLAKEFCMPDSHCQNHEERSDGPPLRYSSYERSSLALACSEAQLISLVKCEQEGLPAEAPGEIAMEHNLRSEDSKIQAHPYDKQNAGVNQWLEQRKHKYPTPANMLRKAEERRKHKEMGEFFNKKPKNHLRRIKGVFSSSHHRRENQRLDKQTDIQEQRMDKSQLTKVGGKGLSSNPGSGPDYSANGFEMPMEIEDSGPIESPNQGGHGSDLEKGIQEENWLCISRSGEPTEQIDKEETRSPCFTFVSRRKRLKLGRGDQRSLVVQRQRKLLFKLLDRDPEKENSHLLQCCRFVVNNHLLQGLAHTNLRHFSWVGAEKLSDEGSSLAEEVATPKISAIASDLSAKYYLAENNQRSLNLDEQECFSEGTNGCQSVSTTVIANAGEKSCSIDLTQEAYVLPAEELGCINTEHERIEEDAHGPSMPVEEFLAQGVEPAQASGCCSKNKELLEEGHGSTLLTKELRSCNKEQDPLGDVSLLDDGHGSTLPTQELRSCNKEQDPLGDVGLLEEGHGFTLPTEELRSRYKEQDPLEVFPNSSSHEIDVDQVHPELVMTSHHQSAMNGCVLNAESSLVLEPSCTQYEKEGVFPWKHPNTGDPGRFDCFKGVFITSSDATDAKQSSMLSITSNADSQGHVSALWDQSNPDLCLPSHDTDIGELGSGMDSLFGDDDDFLQYMNLDAFETDSRMCYG